MQSPTLGELWHYMHRVLATLALAVAWPALAQSPTRVEHRASCANCEIVVTPLITLGSPSDPVHPAKTYSLERDSRGRFFAIAASRTAVIVYGPDGRFIRTVGSAGDSLGEFGRGIVAIGVGSDDSLRVVDSQRRLSVLSPDLTFVRRFTLPRNAAGAAFVEAGQTVLTTELPLGDPFANPFVLVDGEGKMRGGFGPPTPRARDEAWPDSPLVRSPDGRSFWTWRPNYRLEQWRITGEKIADLLVIDADWLPEWKPSPLTHAPPRVPGLSTVDALKQSFNYLDSLVRVTPPSATFDLAGLDPAGNLWVSGFVPRAGGSGINWYDLVVDVIDPVRGQLLASQRLPNPGIRFLPGTNFAFARTEDSAGVTSFVIYRAELRRR